MSRQFSNSLFLSSFSLTHPSYVEDLVRELKPVIELNGKD